MKMITILVLLITPWLSLKAQDLDYAKHIVKELSSPEFKGRGFVENGEKIAAEFISGQYASFSLKPVSQESYFQEFEVPVNTFPGKVSLKLNKREFIAAKDYLVDPSSPPVKGKFKVTSVSRSDINTEEKLVSVIRKAGDSFILIDNQKLPAEAKNETKTVDEYIRFIRYSPQIPAKGVILYSKDKLTWGGSSFLAPRPTIIINGETDPKEITEIELTINSKFIEQYTTQNVIGQIEGTGNSDSMIVLTAHYDHLGKLGKNVYFPGANDNASGIALILNLARYYSENPPEYTMVFMALSAEEIGLLGAKAFTENPTIDLDKIKFLVNFDLAGTGDEGIRIVNGSVYRDEFDLISRLNQENNYLPKVDIRGAACNSDHCMFHQKDVRSFYIYTQGGIQAYHDIYDRYETLPFTEFVDYCRLMIDFFDAL